MELLLLLLNDAITVSVRLSTALDTRLNMRDASRRRVGGAHETLGVRDPMSLAKSPPAGGAASSQSGTVKKALTILSLFDVDTPEWSFTDICKRTGMPKATAFRLLKTLEGLQYLAIDPRTGRYHLGTSMLKAAYLTLSHSALVRIANPHMQRLAVETTETINLAVPTDQGAMIVDTVLTPRPFKPHNPPGMLMPGLANVHARVFLAFRPESEWQPALALPMEHRTEYAITDPDSLADELARVRREGVSYGLQEWNLGMCAVGTPVFDSSGGVRACLAVVAPSERFGPTETVQYAAAAQKAAGEISKELGYDESRRKTTDPDALARLS
jgi:DNA-binding IclR family transcriptional regulator